MGFFQLVIDRHLDAEVIKSRVRTYFGPDRTITYQCSQDENFEYWWSRDGNTLDVEIVVKPLSTTYPLLIEIWQPGPDSLEEERRFAIYFSKAVGCRSIITDEERNPYSWYCVDPSGTIETIYLTDADMGTEED